MVFSKTLKFKRGKNEDRHQPSAILLAFIGEPVISNLWQEASQPKNDVRCIKVIIQANRSKQLYSDLS
jgi:hypothetical protein